MNTSAPANTSLQDLKDAFNRYRETEIDLYELVLQAPDDVLEKFKPWFEVESSRIAYLRKQLQTQRLCV